MGVKVDPRVVMARALGEAGPVSLGQGSVSSMASSELLEIALRDLTNSPRGRACCRGEPITESGKRHQMIKMNILVLCPVVLLLILGGYYIGERATETSNNRYTRTVMEFSIGLGNLMYKLQNERDHSVLYVSSIGSSTRSFLHRSFIETDQVLESLSKWPVELQSDQKSYLQSKTAFRKHLDFHRGIATLNENSVNVELAFYNELIAILENLILEEILKTKSSVWKSLVAYQKVSEARSHAGVERALGVRCYSQGGFSTHGDHLWYLHEHNIYTNLMKKARKYSSMMVDSFSNLYNSDSADIVLFGNIEKYKVQLMYGNISQASVENAALYFDDMTKYLDTILENQTDLGNFIIRLVDNQDKRAEAVLAVTLFVMCMIVGLVPLLVNAVYKTTTDIQSYAITLADKTKQLNREKRKTDSLIYTMLPRQVARKLKSGVGAGAEYFKEVTIMFSNVAGFTSMTSILSPMQIVQMLNELYTLFDGRIDLYDVYKVETIKDSYMVASGLPDRNGSLHASEIARLALDLKMSCANVEICEVPNGKIKLRIGIHTGPVMAGIVGKTMPRYCLFGDTVNTASRMETHGENDQIHISRSTQKLLHRSGGFSVIYRGSIAIKGKGEMDTFWLLGLDTAPAVLSSSSESDLGISTFDLNKKIDEIKVQPCPRNPIVSWSAAPGRINNSFKRTSSMITGSDVGATSGSGKPSTIYSITDVEFLPPSYSRSTSTACGQGQPPYHSYNEVERIFKEKEGSPPILQLAEGYHY